MMEIQIEKLILDNNDFLSGGIDMLQSIIVTVMGLLVLFLASTKSIRGVRAILFTLVGVAYVYIGLFVIRDPPINWETSIQLATMLSGAYIVGKALSWAICKTDIYQNLNNALISLPELKTTVVDFKKEWEKIHKIEI